MIVFGSRGSDLALAQSKQIAEQVRARTGEHVRIEVMQTTGDRIIDKPLAGIGIKGLFTRELEDALRDGRIDAAVHSLKDLPVEDPDGLAIGAIPPRADPADVLLARPDTLRGEHGALLSRLQPGTRFGTSSPRRALAAGVQRDDLDIADIRGNVPTRVDKARLHGDYGAVVLAAAGLDRLAQDVSGLITEHLPVAQFTPAPGQGALGVQCRRDDERVRAALASVHCPTSAACANNERAVLLGLGGGCSMPLGVLIEPVGEQFRLRAALYGGSPVTVLRAAAIGKQPERLAEEVVAAWRPIVGAPLQGLRVATARPDGDRTGLAAALAIAGAEVQSLAWTHTVPLPTDDAALDEVRDCDALAFTSQRAVRHFTEQCEQRGVAAFPAERRVLAVGASTATELVQRGCVQLAVADGRGGESLARLCEQQGLRGTRIGMPCAEQRRPEFERAASKLDIDVRPLPVYRLDSHADGAGVPTDVDAFVFSSPSAVDAFLQRGAAPTGNAQSIAIGETTAQHLESRGFDNVVALASPTPAALIAALATEQTS